MSFKINVKCIRKSESVMDENNTYTEITLQPETGTGVMPTQPQPQPAQPSEPPVYGMMNGMTITLRDSKEAANYQVGEMYEISVTAVAKK